MNASLLFDTNTDGEAAPTTNTNIQLYPYQLEALEAIEKHRANGENRQLLALATGGGKTIVFNELTRRLDAPTLQLAHRDELINQSVAKLRMVWPEADIGVVRGEKNETGHQVTIASVQTLTRLNRFQQAFQTQTDLDRLRLLVTDEAHHATADSYRRIYEAFGLMVKGQPGSPLHLGVTATPERGDKTPLAEIYDVIAFEWGIKQGIEQGYLSDLTGYTLEFDNEDIADVRTNAGDFVASQLENAVNKIARNEAIVEAWKEQARLEDGTYRPTIAFCVTVAHAEDLAEAFSKAGVKADVVHGELSEEARKAVLYRYATGDIDVLSNCAVLTEGFDEPKTACIIMARPTKSRSLYQQCVGRGTRRYFGKENCLILDVADVARRHILTAAVSLGEALGLKKKKITSAAQAIAEERNREYLQNEVRGGQKFDPFSRARDPFEHTRSVSFRWTKGGSGLTLSLPKDKVTQAQRWIVVTRRPDNLFDLVEVTRLEGYASTEQRFINQYGLPDEVAAAKMGELHALKLYPNIWNLAGRDAYWRTRQAPPTPGQLETLRKMYRGNIPTSDQGQLTKAVASLLISQKIGERVKVTITRRPDELEG